MITLYTQPGCPHCDDAKTHLMTENVAFNVENIHENLAALDFLKENGHTTVPQLYYGTFLLAPGGNVGIQELSHDQINIMIENLA